MALYNKNEVLAMPIQDVLMAVGVHMIRKGTTWYLPKCPSCGKSQKVSVYAKANKIKCWSDECDFGKKHGGEDAFGALEAINGWSFKESLDAIADAYNLKAKSKAEVLVEKVLSPLTEEEYQKLGFRISTVKDERTGEFKESFSMRQLWAEGEDTEDDRGEAHDNLLIGHAVDYFNRQDKALESFLKMPEYHDGLNPSTLAQEAQNACWMNQLEILGILEKGLRVPSRNPLPSVQEFREYIEERQREIQTAYPMAA